MHLWRMTVQDAPGFFIGLPFPKPALLNSSAEIHPTRVFMLAYTYPITPVEALAALLD